MIDDPINEEDGPQYAASGTLLGSPKMKKGNHYLTLTVEKIGLKQATDYLDPYFTVLVMDADGKSLETAQDTPVSNKKQGFYIDFDQKIHIQTAIEDLPKGSAIFFEFKHFKPSSQKMSTKAWAFMEDNEIKEGPIVLEM